MCNNDSNFSEINILGISTRNLKHDNGFTSITYDESILYQRR